MGEWRAPCNLPAGQIVHPGICGTSCEPSEGALRDLIESQETYKGSGVEVAAVAAQRAAPADEDRSKIDAWLAKSRR